jgi:hypothetical protein
MYFIPIVRPLLTYLEYSSNLLPDLDIGLISGVAGRQGMRTPPRQLVRPLVFPGFSVSLIFTVDYSIYLTWTLILTADLSIYLTVRNDVDCG